MERYFLTFGKILIMVGFAFFIIENFYFGWNELPMSEAEIIADNVVRLFFYGGFFVYSLPVWRVYENAVNKLSKND